MAQTSQPVNNARHKTSETLLGIEKSWSDVTAVGNARQATKPLKPFQGLKMSKEENELYSYEATKPLKPFQGLKSLALCVADSFFTRHKTSETLLGIEKQQQLKQRQLADSHKTSETLLGIEKNKSRTINRIILATKPLKPFQGLKKKALLVLD